jgi:selenocysteine lyase/cysteine desulfurase
VADLICVKPENIVFTSGTTQGLNWVAEWHRNAPTVIISEAEHHANIVPWLQQGRTVDNGRLRVIPMDPHTGQIDLAEAERIISSCDPRSLVSIIATSNVTGIRQPWPHIARIAHSNNHSVCVDFCQTIAHDQIDLSETQIEWDVFSAHKMYGPTGIGALYSAFDYTELKAMQYGGGAVEHVSFSDVRFMPGVHKHEPGTPNVASIIGFGVAADLMLFSGYERITHHENAVCQQLYDAGILDLPVNWVGPCIPNPIPPEMSWYTGPAIYSFLPRNAHSSDLGALLANTHSCVRTGKLCAHPYVDSLSNRGVVRISIAPYNTQRDCETLVSDLRRTLEILQ